VGRARDEENVRAVTCASEAVHIALRMTQLDLVALADEAMPRAATASVPPVSRVAGQISADRILRALPT